MDEPYERRRTESLLRLIAEGTAAAVGEEFFQALVRHLAEALTVRYAFVSEFAEVRTRVQTLAFWAGDGFLDNFEFDLAGTPCEAVLAGEMRCYKQGIQTLFPSDEGLATLNAESYLAVPLIERSGDVMGHLALLDIKPMDAEPRELSVFKIFAARARAELERKRAEEALARSERWLSSILGSTMDAVITIDARRHVTMFNTAAERVFGCAAAWALGQPFDRFLSRPFRSLLDSYIRSLDAGSGGRQQMWAPEGLTALRANREEFPIEATVSPLEMRGEKYYTIILRDVNERRRTEAELQRLQWERSYLQEELNSANKFEDMVGESEVMRRLFEEIAQVAGTDSTVLLLGETGTGKELLAHAIHNRSLRREKLLVKMNCAALPSELIESELFGHEKGAFTGATAQRKGRFELADAGTLFLDEVGELSPAAQAKLLRVLQEQEFERVGGTKTLKVDVRLIAATNRDLLASVKAGQFRSDLYYRLNVFPIEVPPLRARGEDIAILARHILRHLARKLGKPLSDIAPASLQRLRAYAWPGNIRELQNVIERAAVLAKTPLVDVDLALTLASEPAPGAAPAGTLEEIERAHIFRVLENTGWVIEGKRGAAGILGMGPSTLRYRMQKLGIKRPEHKSS